MKTTRSPESLRSLSLERLVRASTPITALRDTPQTCQRDYCKLILAPPTLLLDKLGDRGLSEMNEGWFILANQIIREIMCQKRWLNDVEKKCLERKRYRVRGLLKKYHIKLNLQRAVKISEAACQSKHFGQQLLANDMAAWAWTNHWPYGWSELDEKMRRADTQKIERGFTFFTTSEKYETWEDYQSNLENKAKTYEERIHLHSNDVYLEDTLARAVKLANNAHWFKDRKLMIRADKILQDAVMMGPQKCWSSEHWEKIIYTKNFIDWFKDDTTHSPQ